MLSWQRDWRALVLLAAFALSVDLALSSFWTCSEIAEQASQNTGHQQSEKYCSAFKGPLLMGLGMIVTRVGIALEGHENAVIAIFTMVIAFSTAALWAATRDLWVATKDAADAAKLSATTAAEAFTILERPYVLPGEIRINQSQDHKWYASCRIGNYGRTPAIIHDVLEGFSDSPEPSRNPSDPDYVGGKKRGRDFNASGVLGSGEKLPNRFEMYFPGVIEFDPSTWKLTYQGRDAFLVINIRFEDTRGVKRRQRFTWKYHRAYRRFLRYGGKAYNFEQEIENPE